MQGLKLLAALAAGGLACPAAASEIVQTSSSSSPVPGGFVRFNPLLGTLNSVTLSVTTTDNRTASVNGPLPTGTSSPVIVDWSINGMMALTVSILGGASLPTQNFAIAGAGRSSVASPGLFDLSASGSASFLLDPNFFLFDTPFFYDFAITAADAGLFNANLDTSFTPNQPATVVGVQGACYGGTSRGGDQCNNTRYTLTYNFTAVPEPGTWAMMLIGFLACGVTVRRRRFHAISLSGAG